MSDVAKRVLGCFIFQTLDEHLGAGGSELPVRDTLQTLANDYRIHEPEFRYWALVDVDGESKGSVLFDWSQHLLISFQENVNAAWRVLGAT